MSKKQRRDIPRFAHPIIETHCHLDYLEADALAEELQTAREVGVERIITIAVSPGNLDTVQDLAQREDRVFCTQGVHPHEAEAYNAEVDQRIRQAASNPKVVAIGEIGLDYFYDHADRAIQRQVFADQLLIAAACDLPVVIHSRDADEDMQAILTEHLESLPKRGVIHSFSSGLSLAEFALEAGFMLGFNGMVTFNSANNVRDAVALTPVNQILLETDAPYLTPVPYRGRSNGPRYLPFVAEKVAEIKDLPIEELLKQCFANSERLFFTHAQDADVQ
ncbi:MAG: TatD DNase family protein [Glaciecola sp.]|jgi:TatD DNase family protein|uniref:TatD family hydrolase n=1 Tax=Congregibacter sp. TaxID=2744308 RepID=UPI0039E3A67A